MSSSSTGGLRQGQGLRSCCRRSRCQGHREPRRCDPARGGRQPATYSKGNALRKGWLRKSPTHGPCRRRGSLRSRGALHLPSLSLSFDALAPLVAISPALILSAAEKSLPVGALTAAFSLSPPPSSLVSLRWVRCCCSSSVHAAAAARRTARLERPGERRFCVGQGPQHPVRQDGLSFPDDCAEVL